jgi:hypothetical protein
MILFLKMKFSMRSLSLWRLANSCSCISSTNWSTSSLLPYDFIDSVILFIEASSSRPYDNERFVNFDFFFGFYTLVYMFFALPDTIEFYYSELLRLKDFFDPFAL